MATYTLASLVAFGVFVYISQYLQFVLGLSPLHAGLWTMPLGAAFIAGSTLTPMIARRVRPADVIAGGLTLAAVGFAVLTQIGGGHDLVVIEFGMVIFSLGLAPVFTVVNDVIVGTASPERAGVVSAISETGSEFGGAIGIAILGSLGTAVGVGASAKSDVGTKLDDEAAYVERFTRLRLQHLGEFMNGHPNKTHRVATLKGFRTSVAGVVLIAGFAVAFPRADEPIGSRATPAGPRFKAIAFDYFVLFQPRLRRGRSGTGLPWERP